MSRRTVIVTVVAIAVSLGVLYVVAIALAGLQFARSLSGANDPAKARAVAEQIGHFDVPSGYRIASATDMVFVRFVMMVAKSPTSPMIMMLEGVNSPVSSDASIFQALRATGNSVPCAGAANRHDLRFSLGARTYSMHRTDCTDRGIRTRVEALVLPARSGAAIFMASGLVDGWDERPVRSLLASFRG